MSDSCGYNNGCGLEEKLRLAEEELQEKEKENYKNLKIQTKN